jgi:hypothetical protein
MLNFLVKRLLHRLASPWLPAVITLLTRFFISAQLLRSLSPEKLLSNETGAIAAALVDGRGFASPYHLNAPTAWLAPAYPFFLSIVFRLFGVRSAMAAWMLVLANSVFAALACYLTFLLARKYFGAATATIAAWLWALCWQSAVVPLIIWDTSVSALLVASGLLLITVLEISDDWSTWVGAGAFLGLAGLTNPALLGPVPFIGIYLAWFRKQKGRPAWSRLALATIVCGIVLLPWMIRNYQQFGRIFFIRSNFAAEIYFANVGYETHPSGPSGEYQRLGETEYLQQKREALQHSVRHHPGAFARYVMKNVWVFWTMPNDSTYWIVMSMLCFTGFALAMKALGTRSLPFGIALGVYPLTYYLTLVYPKYRHPLEPVLFVLSGYAVWRVAKIVGQSFGRKSFEESARA